MHYLYIINAMLYKKCIKHLKRVYSLMSKNESSGWTLHDPIWTPYSESCGSTGPLLTYN